jgi:hypothetical protein
MTKNSRNHFKLALHQHHPSLVPAEESFDAQQQVPASIRKAAISSLLKHVQCMYLCKEPPEAWEDVGSP